MSPDRLHSAAPGCAAASRALRWPAEWERHEATWLSWPHNPDTWPDRLDAATRAFVAIARALAPHERVRINVCDDAHEEGARRRLGEAGVEPEGRIEFFRIATDDAWVRDHGPLFLEDEGCPVILDFSFNAWGGKYPPWDRDDAVPQHIARTLGLPRLEPGLVLEGGSIDGNGRGTLITTEACLLNDNRGPGRTRESMESVLERWLGARHVIWLGDGIVGDDTDGHVDDVTRFVEPGTVVTAVEDDPGDPNHRALAENLRRLRAATDGAGKPLSIAMLPMPPAQVEAGDRLPASYANFYLANGVALVPTFGVREDDQAIARLAEVLPGREVVGVPSRDLILGLGAVHCVTQQQPACDSAPS